MYMMIDVGYSLISHMHLIAGKVIPYKDTRSVTLFETSLCSALVQKQVKWEPVVRGVKQKMELLLFTW